MFAWKPGKGITLEMYIRNTQVNKKKNFLSVKINKENTHTRALAHTHTHTHTHIHTPSLPPTKQKLTVIGD